MSFPVLDSSFILDTRTVVREPLHRVYWRGADPLATSVAANHRYDCPALLPPTARFGMLYLGFDLETCWLETVVRGGVVRPAGAVIPIPANKLTDRWARELAVARPLTLATFADEPLVHLGDCASNIMGDSYLRTKQWAALLHAHANPQVDGLAYRSRFRTHQFCIA